LSKYITSEANIHWWENNKYLLGTYCARKSFCGHKMDRHQEEKKVMFPKYTLDFYLNRYIFPQNFIPKKGIVLHLRSFYSPVNVINTQTQVSSLLIHYYLTLPLFILKSTFSVKSLRKYSSPHLCHI